MASEYLKWKYRDEKPDEKQKLSPKEKRKNWWHYHKWYVVIGVALVGIGINLVCHALGVGQTKPDYQVAYIGENALPDDTAAAIENTFAALGEDQNSDGQVVVQLNQYPMTGLDPTIAAASQTTLMAGLVDYESYFFLLEDPEWFQMNYRSLSLLDGSLPEEGDYSAEGTYLPWTECPVLARAELGDYSYPLLGKTVTGSSDELVSTLYLARRGFWQESDALNFEGCNALWNRLTEGAVS